MTASVSVIIKMNAEMLNYEKKKIYVFQESLVRLYDTHYLFIRLFHNVFLLQCSYNDRPLISQA